MKNWKKRAIRTFIQTAVGYLAVNVPMIDWSTDWSVLKTALIGLGVSTVAAGVAAVVNFLEDENKKFE